METMTVLLVGRAGERADLRARCEGLGILVRGENETLREARASGDDSDAILIARSRAGEEAPPVEALTTREAEVRDLLAEGLSSKAIATRLGTAHRTVKVHVALIVGHRGDPNL